jgi:hypothetical protein
LPKTARPTNPTATRPTHPKQPLAKLTESAWASCDCDLRGIFLGQFASVREIGSVPISGTSCLGFFRAQCFAVTRYYRCVLRGGPIQASSVTLSWVKSSCLAGLIVVRKCKSGETPKRSAPVCLLTAIDSLNLSDQAREPDRIEISYSLGRQEMVFGRRLRYWL